MAGRTPEAVFPGDGWRSGKGVERERGERRERERGGKRESKERERRSE